MFGWLAQRFVPVPCFQLPVCLTNSSPLLSYIAAGVLALLLFAYQHRHSTIGQQQYVLYDHFSTQQHQEQQQQQQQQQPINSTTHTTVVSTARPPTTTFHHSSPSLHAAAASSACLSACHISLLHCPSSAQLRSSHRPVSPLLTLVVVLVFPLVRRPSCSSLRSL